MGYEHYIQRLDRENQRVYRKMHETFLGYKQMVEIDSYEMDYNKILSTYFDLYLDHPELFYTGPSCSLNYLDNGNGTMHYSINGEFIANKYIIEKRAEVIQNFLTSFRKKCRLKSDKEIIKMWLVWLIKNVEYSINNLMNQNASRVLVDLVGQCSGAAAATKLVFDYLGIDAIIIYGDAVDERGREAHAWNIVKVDGEWYQLDPTWVFGMNKTVPEGHYDFRYALKSDKTFSKDHDWKREEFPKCNKDLTL